MFVIAENNLFRVGRKSNTTWAYIEDIWWFNVNVICKFFVFTEDCIDEQNRRWRAWYWRPFRRRNQITFWRLTRQIVMKLRKVVLHKRIKMCSISLVLCSRKLYFVVKYKRYIFLLPKRYKLGKQHLLTCRKANLY